MAGRPWRRRPRLHLVASNDVAHLDRPGGDIGLMAASKARAAIWPEIAGRLGERGTSDNGAHTCACSLAI